MPQKSRSDFQDAADFVTIRVTKSNLGDQQAALVDQACYSPGEAKNTYRAGCFMLLNTGTSAIALKTDLLNTLAYKIGEQPAYCALEGSIAVTGALVQWFRDNLGIIRKSADIEDLARSVDDNEGMVYNDLLMSFQADILGVPVVRRKIAETTALGAAYAAGLAVGFWNSLEDLRENWQVNKTWQPHMTAETRQRLYSGWLKAVERTFNWIE